MNKLMRKIEKLESETVAKQSTLEQVMLKIFLLFRSINLKLYFIFPSINFIKINILKMIQKTCFIVVQFFSLVEKRKG